MSATEDEDTDDGIPRPRNEISIRDYERKQLVAFLPDVIDIYAEYEDDAMVEKKEAFEEMLAEFDEEIDGTEADYDLGSNNWRDLAVGLEELDSTKASWLKAKIGRRAELSTIHMGFTTNVPFMTLVTGEDPVRPDRQ